MCFLCLLRCLAALKAFCDPLPKPLENKDKSMFDQFS